MTKTFKLTISRTGIPCLWESGGGSTNTGEATIIAGKIGLPLFPIYIRERGPLACENHALIPVTAGCFVVKAIHHRRDFTVQIWRILNIIDDTAQAELAWEYSEGQFGDPASYIGSLLLQNLKAAMNAAVEKATCYHCREPHYIKEAQP